MDWKTIMDFDWIQLFIYAPIHLLLAWVLVIPLWGAWVITGFAILELLIGILLLVMDIKQYKRYKEEEKNTVILIRKPKEER